MNQQTYISPSIFVFSKWSRKEYAIFASLGKLIKIGVLKADICQKALLKGLVDLNNNVGIKEDCEEDETELSSPDQNSLQLILSSLGLSVLQSYNLVSSTTSEKVNPLRNILYSQYKVCFLLNVRNRLFFSTQINL
jgi:hypothetical protein